MGKSKLDVFTVSLVDEISKDVVLKRKPLAKLRISDIMEQMGDLKFSKQEMENVGNTLINIMEELSKNSEVRSYLNEMIINKFDPSIKQKREDAMRAGITKLCQMLVDNEYIVSASKNAQRRRKDYDKFLKCICALSRVFPITVKDPIFIVASLNMIAQASEVCASGWKDTLTTISVNFRDDIENMFSEIECEKDEMKKLLQQVFFNAKDSVTKELEYKYIKENNVPIPDRPHYTDVFTKVFNEKYNLNLPQMEATDSYMEEAKQIYVKETFIESLQSVPIYGKIYNKACEFFYDKFKEDGKSYGILADWAREYINKNNLKEQVSDVSEFVSEYIMTGDYDDKIKYLSIREIMKDYGFIEERKQTKPLGKISAKLKNIRLKRVMYDLKTEQEINNMNRDLVNLYKENVDISFVFDFINETKKYDIIFHETIQNLIEIGKNKDKKLILGFCKMGHINATKLLLDSVSKINLNVRNDDGETPLMLAIKNKMGQEVIEKLLERKMDLNIKSKHKKTALMVAIENGVMKDVIEKLIQKGVNTGVRTNTYDTMLMLAIKNKASLDVINMLLRHNKTKLKTLLGKKNTVDKQNMYGQTALMIALQENADDEVIMQLLNNGANVNIADNSGKTTLMYAARYTENPKIMKAVLEKIRNKDAINMSTNQGVTALMTACRYNKNPEVIKVLLDNGASITKVNNVGSQALVYASIYNDNPKIIDVLLEYGANVNARNSNNDTALMYALKHNPNKDIAKLLIKEGAEVDIVNKSKLTPLMIAVKRSKDLELIKLILDGVKYANTIGENGWTELMLASKYNPNQYVINEMLKKGADVNKSNNEGYTALMFASQKSDNVEIVRTIIDNGADVNARTKNKDTALILACEYNKNAKIITELIDKGAHINKVNNEGKTALMYAMKNGSKEVIKAMLDKGADVNIVDNKGNTAIIYATQNNLDKEIITWLKEKGEDLANCKEKTPYTKTIEMDVKKDNIKEEISSIIEKQYSVDKEKLEL